MRRLAALAAILGLIAGACGGTASNPPTSTPALTATPAPTVAPTAEPTPAPTPEPTAEPTPRPPATWALVTAAGSGPAAREDHTWTVDPEGVTAYLFGGRNGGTTFADLYAFDLATDTWRALAPDGSKPAGRFGHEAAWVDGVGLVVFAGQANATTFFGDLWAYDPAANRWTELPAAGAAPVPRYGSCSGVGPDGRLWISHGFTEDRARFFDTKAYDFDLQRWIDLTPDGRTPVERCLHACWWTGDGRFVLYGGQTTTVAALGDLWSLTPGSGDTPGAWTQFDGTLPAERALPAFASFGESQLVFGGKSIGGAYLGDAYVVDGRSLTVSPPMIEGASPSGRASSTLIEDRERAHVLLFGGTGTNGAFSELWQLSTP